MIGLGNLRYFIEVEISKKRAEHLVKSTPEPEALAAELWDFILLNEHPISWRANWFLEHLGAENREFVRPYLQSIVKAFPTFKFDGQRRSSMKILLMFPITDYDYGRMVNYCFDLLLSHEDAVAVRMFAMLILVEIVKLEPELKGELKDTIEFILPNTQKGLQSICRRTLVKLDKM